MLYSWAFAVVMLWFCPVGNKVHPSLKALVWTFCFASWLGHTTRLACYVSLFCCCAAPKVRNESHPFDCTCRLICTFSFPLLPVDIAHISSKDQNTITTTLRRAVPSSETDMSTQSNNFASTIFYYLARWVHVMKVFPFHFWCICVRLDTRVSVLE